MVSRFGKKKIQSSKQKKVELFRLTTPTSLFLPFCKETAFEQQNPIILTSCVYAVLKAMTKNIFWTFFWRSHDFQLTEITKSKCFYPPLLLIDDIPAGPEGC